MQTNAAPRPSGQDLRPSKPPFSASGFLTPLLVGLLCLVLCAISWERGRGNIHKLTSRVLPAPPSGGSTGPGGQDVVHLIRTPDAASSDAEFISATVLPGRGMNLFQLTALVPGHGEVPLLASPPLDEATGLLTGQGADANGEVSATLGGAFLVPWAGRLLGKPSTTPGLLQTLWEGQRLTFPPVTAGGSLSTPGLLLDRGADTTHSEVVLNGQSVEGVFHPGTFSGNWPSTGSVHISVEIAGHTADLAVTVQNTGSVPMPVGVGWLPYFAIASHDREHATLTIPSGSRLEVNHSTGVPTGRILPIAGTPLDFMRARGTPLGRAALNETYVHLTTAVLASGPVAELRDTTFGYGLRLYPLTSSIKALHVVAPADKPWVIIAPNTNFDDPLGPQWEEPGGSGISILQPGDSVQWKVRLEIFSLAEGRRSSGI